MPVPVSVNIAHHKREAQKIKDTPLCDGKLGRKEEEKEARHPAGFKPTTFQFSNWQVGTRTAVHHRMPFERML